MPNACLEGGREGERGGGVLSNLIELQDSDRWVFSPRLLVCQTLGHTQLTGMGGEVGTERRWGQKGAEGKGGGRNISRGASFVAKNRRATKVRKRALGERRRNEGKREGGSW